MKTKVEKFIRKHCLLKENDNVIVGVSGGPDSLALLHLLWSLKKEWNIEVIAAHLDHMFRGEQSREDLLYVKNFCFKHDIPCEAISIDVEAYKKKHHLSSQIAARECRYQFYEDVMKKHKGTKLALAHHGDDQVETILMRLTRGTTMKGAAGMAPSRSFADGALIRPFLALTKDEIEVYCQHYELHPRIDPSNSDDKYTRNRFRKLLPFFKKENEHVHTHFQQFSEKLLEDQSYLEELTYDMMNTVIVDKTPEYVKLLRQDFLRMRKPLQRRGIQLILNYLYKEIPLALSSAHIDQLFAFFKEEQPSGMLHFPKGLYVIRSYETCLFTFEKPRVEPYCFSLHIPGRVTLPTGREIVCEIHKTETGKLKKGHDFFHLPLNEKAKLPNLIVRSRKTGDKIRLKGMNGRKKVKDIFIDNKIPKSEREAWPIVMLDNEEILWIPGLKKSHYEVDNIQEQKYVTLYYK
jgi:tRNA(Ile)-lysidine synthase